MQKNNCRRTKYGFTMMELLAAVAILIVLFAVSAPAVNAIKANLSWKKANGIAKEIYVVAQNQSIHMRSNNALDSFQNSVYGTSSNPGVCYTQKVNTKPADYSKSNQKYKNLYYIAGNQSTPISYIIPNVTQQSITGSYIVEINPNSGDVYGVFYSEELTSAQLLAAYEAGMTGDEDTIRPEENRKENTIGYYGGVGDAGLSMEGNEVNIEVYNEEQLYVKVNVPNANYDNAFSKAGTSGDINFKMEFVIADEHGNKIVRSGSASNLSGTDINKPIYVKNKTFGGNGSVDAYLILDDSINSTPTSFSELNKGLTPGDDITVYAQACYISTESKYLTTQLYGNTNSVTVNSLFGDGTDISNTLARNSDGSIKDTVIKVSNCRHLRNLSTFRNDSTWAITDEGRSIRTQQKVVIDQTNDIDFGKLSATKTSDAGICPVFRANGNVDSSDNADDCSLSFNAKTSYSPIDNIYLFGTNIRNWSKPEGDGARYSNRNNIYNGHGNEIQNLSISGKSQSGTGLFGKYNCYIKDVHLRNVKVYSESDATSGCQPSVGALIGNASGGYAVIENCGVYCTSPAETGFGSKYSEVNVSNYSVEGVAGVGGLVGRIGGYSSSGGVPGSKIINSFAAVPVRARGGGAGGLVGRIEAGSSVTNCYSSGSVRGPYDVGGVAGVNKGGTIKNCYTTSYIYPEDGETGYCAGGICGKLYDSGMINTCTFYGTIVFPDGVDSSKTAAGVIADVAHQETDNSGDTSEPVRMSKGVNQTKNIVDCAYLNMPDYNDNYKSSTSSKLKSTGYDGVKSQSHKTNSYETLCVLTDSNASARKKKSFPYSKSLKNEAFPFAFISTIGYHYGDWPADNSAVFKPTLVYYEKYFKNGKQASIGYYADDLSMSDGTALGITGLKTSLGTGEYVYEAGYAVLIQEGDTVELNGAETKLSTLVESGIKLSADVTASAYALPSSYQSYSLSNDSDKKFYKDLKIDDTQYYYNPCVAKAISTTDGTPTSAEIRTAKQFWNLGQNKGFWGKFGSSQVTYSQTLNIDYGTYNGTKSIGNSPIGTVSIPFENNYNGGGNTIVGYNIQIDVGDNSDLEETGIFGKASGATLSNIHLVGDGNTSYIKGTFTGNTNYKCIVLGGIVGYLKNSTLTNSSISGYNVTAQYSGSQQGEEIAVVAGLVGASAGTISNCSAVNKKVSLETTTLSKSKTSDIRISIAGLCGNVAQGSGMNNCYSGGALSFKNSSSNGVYAYLSGIANGANKNLYTNGTHTVKNCYSYCEIETNYSKAYTFGGCPTSSEHPSNDSISICTVENCSYLKPSTAFKYNGATAKTYAELVAMADTKAAADHSFPWTAKSAVTDAYPFKAVVKDASNAYVHYGDWPANKACDATGYIGAIRFHNKSSGAAHYDICYYELTNGVVTKEYREINCKNIPEYTGIGKSEFSGNLNVSVFWNFEANPSMTVTYKLGSLCYGETKGASGHVSYNRGDDAYYPAKLYLFKDSKGNYTVESKEVYLAYH